MTQEMQARLSRLHVLFDALIIVISYVLAYWLVFDYGGKLPAYTKEFYFGALFFIVPVLMILYWMFRLYAPKRVMGRRLELSNVFKANLIGLFIMTMVMYLGKEALKDFSRPLVFFFIGINFVLDGTFRLIVKTIIQKYRVKGYNQKQVLLIGYSRAAQRYITRVRLNPAWGYNIRGILDDDAERGMEFEGVRVIGHVEDLDTILEMSHLDEIAITLGLEQYHRLEHIVSVCEKSGVHTKFIPDYYKIIPTKPYTEDLQGLPVIHIRYVPLSDSFNMAIKRAVDIFGALVAIILFSPIMLLAAIGVKLSSPGPIIFKQERVGLHNRTFTMYKFRSMGVQAPEDEKKGWSTKGDPRVTKFGSFIRKTSIDELPQLFNILFGDMSLVGPRPERPQYVEKFREEIPRYMIKHQVRPGLTGWAQVNGFRGDTSIPKRIEHDLYYIENWTLGFDFKIIILTFFKGFVNKNAY